MRKIKILDFITFTLICLLNLAIMYDVDKYTLLVLSNGSILSSIFLYLSKEKAVLSDKR